MKSRLESIAAVLLGIAVTYIVYGYQFGTSNHTVYLLSALRETNPQLLAHDWFTTQTLQYHAAFGWLTFVLNKLHILQPAFWMGYLLLVAMLHIAWFGIGRLFNGTTRTYLLSVVLYHLSAGGTGLGMYQFLQDSSFLPSNIAAVALLWGLYLRMRQKWIAAAICFAIAEVFHLNYALVCVGLWLAISMINLPTKSPPYLVASFIALAPGLINAAIMIFKLRGHGPSMPLHDFIPLYVNLRHPHHYDLRSWPVALWISFLWPMPFAFRWLKKQLRDEIVRPVGSASADRLLSSPDHTNSRSAEADPTNASARAPVELAITSFLFAGLILIAIVGAGIWYISEPLVQLSLYRFTIYLQLFAIIATAIVIQHTRLHRLVLPWLSIGGAILLVIVASSNLSPIVASRAEAMVVLAITLVLIALFQRLPIRLSLALAMLLLVGVLVRPSASGVIKFVQQDDSDYLAVCDWARDHTPIDAIFLVPPNETEMRLRGQRAIVVNYKCVPQLSSELPQWRDRLQDVLDLPNLLTLPRGFLATERAIGERYDALPPEQLQKAAEKYGARYTVVSLRLDSLDDRLAYSSPSGRYFVYDLARK